MDKMMILTALLALALVVAVFQSFQLASIKSDMARLKAAPATTQVVAAGVNVPSASTGALNNLPNMVGGC